MNESIKFSTLYPGLKVKLSIDHGNESYLYCGEVQHHFTDQQENNYEVFGEDEEGQPKTFIMSKYELLIKDPKAGMVLLSREKIISCIIIN